MSPMPSKWRTKGRRDAAVGSISEASVSGPHGQPDGAGGLRDPIEVARDKVHWILENHHPQPLDEAQRAELARILAAADRDLSYRP